MYIVVSPGPLVASGRSAAKVRGTGQNGRTVVSGGDTSVPYRLSALPSLSERLCTVPEPGPLWRMYDRTGVLFIAKRRVQHNASLNKAPGHLPS